MSVLDRAIDTNLRPLGAVERYFWLSDQNSPKHFLVAAEVRGAIGIDSWRAALDAVQERHPLLSAGVTPRDGGRLHFTEHGRVPIPLRVVRRDAGRTWEQEAARELATPFEIADIPLIRAVVVTAEDVSNVILAVHHSIGDGLSVAHVIRDMLEALSGAVLERLPMRPSQEDVCAELGISLGVHDLQPAVPSERIDRWAAKHLRTLQTRSLRLPVGMTKAVGARARDEGTTVHGAIAAMLALAGRQLNPEWRERPVRMLSPVNTRPFLGLDHDVLPAVLFPAWAYGPAQFWDTARAVTADLTTVRSTAAIKHALDGFQQIVPEATVADIAASELEVSACDLLISNLGVLDFARQFGDLTLEGVWGPAVLVGNEGEQMVGVATIHGSIHLLHSSFEPIARLLETGERILQAAL